MVQYKIINYTQLMQLLLGWNRKKEKKSKPPTIKNTELSALIPVVQSIIMNKCLLLQSDKHPKLIQILTSQLETDVRPFSFRIQIRFDFNNHFLRYCCSLLKNDKILTIASKDLRINFTHKLLHHQNKFNYPQSININQENGEIQIISMINYSYAMMNSLNYLQKEVTIKLTELVKICNNKLKSILQEINQISTFFPEMKIQKLQTLLKIQKHIYFSCKDLGLSEKASSYKYPSDETLKKREEIIKNILDTSQQGSQFELKNGILYGMAPKIGKISQNKTLKRQFQNNCYFQKMLQIPISKVSNPTENTFIYNDIDIVEPQKMFVQVLPTQANCFLKISSIYFHYTFNKSNDNLNYGKNPPINKLVIIKENKYQTKRSKAKLLHQKNIVKIFSSASSGYMIKYYNSYQKDFNFRNGLMMEYNPCSVSLADHLVLTRLSLSLTGKLNLLAHISNGLRFLVYYKIVHMDLNLNNILVCDGYLPKMIDFGEAYQQQVVDLQNSRQNYYSPGFTLPYCSPQVFTSKVFSSCQDVFSFGVLMFRLLTNSLPYFPSDNLINCYASRNYPSKLMFAGQKIDSMACSNVVCLLLQLIQRCMCIEPQNRPLPIWCTIIVKQLISQLYA